MSDQTAVSIESVSKRFRLYHERGTSLKERIVKAGRTRYDELWALQDVSFAVGEGETVGILGHNGSGKSTLLKCICGVLQPTSGQITVQGKLAGLLELGAGFQPELSGRDNIFLNGSMLGLSKREVEAVFDDIVRFAELDQFIDNQVKFYSSGMYVRLGFAVAVNVEPDILVIDEVLAVGDERFQRKCLNKIREFQEKGRTIIFVSHTPDQVRAICDRAVVLNQGSVIGLGSPGQSVRIFRENLLEADESAEEALANEAALAAAAAGLVVDPADRHGDHPVKVTKVSLAYPGSDDRAFVMSGDPLAVRIAFEVTAPVEGAVFSITVTEPKGEVIIRTDTDEADQHFDLVPGHGEIEFSFSSWPFLDGDYAVSVGIQSRLGGVTFDWKEDVLGIEVFYEGKASGLVNLPVTVTMRSDVDVLEETV